MKVDKVKENKSISVTIRLGEATAMRLEEIMQARGLSKTDAIKYCIHSIPILQIGNVSNLANEFYKIRVALESNRITEEVRQEVKGLCQSMSDLLLKVESMKK